MDSEPISSNPSFKHLGEQLEGMEELLPLMEACGLLKGDAKHLPGKLAEMKKSFEEMRSLPDEFNSLFAERGWIAYERMNLEVMRECVSLAKQGKLAEAEEKLVSYYDGEHITWGIAWAKNHPAFLDRWEQMYQQALEEYKAGRYYSCIPLLLIVIDGAVQDVDKTHGLASDGSDVQAWDSIAGHSSGLAVIKKIYTKTRKKTNREHIDLPYRNGILHGRDLNYGSKKLAAKCWGILFATADWAIAKQSELQRKSDLEAEKTPPPIEQTLADLVKHQEDMAKFQQAQDGWKPRTVVLGKDAPVTGSSDEYEEDTPERAVVEFLELWQMGDYGHMAQMITQSWEDGIGKRAGRYRGVFGDRKLKGFRILSVEDQGSAITRITISLDIEVEGKTTTMEHRFDLIHQREEHHPLPRGHEGGSWQIVEGFSDIEFAERGEE